MRCEELDDGLIQALLEGRLTAAQARAVNSHVAICRGCRELVSYSARALNTLAGVSEEERGATAFGAEGSDAGGSSSGCGDPEGSGGDVDRTVLRQGARFGRYVIRRWLGAGGMGAVYRAFDSRLRRDVALKLVRRDDPVLGPKYAERLRREAEALAQLSHHGIVPVYDLAEADDGLQYYTMKEIQGRTLKEALASTRTLADRLELLRSFSTICHAVGHAHDRGIMHGDLKPANIVLGGFGEAVVVDWGLARRLGAAECSQSVAPQTERQAASMQPSAARNAGGTPGYMSPEHTCAGGQVIDQRSDVFSLGVILHEIATGRRPSWGGARGESTDGRRQPEPSDAAEAGSPAELLSICRRALQSNPAARYPDAAALALEVDSFLDGALVAAHAYALSEHLKRWARRHRLQIISAAAVGVLLLAFGVYFYERLIAEHDRAQRSEQEARRSLAISLLEGARLAAGQEDFLQARSKLRESLELADSLQARGLWSELERQPLLWRAPLPAVAYDVQFHPLTGALAVGLDDGRVGLWDAATGQGSFASVHTRSIGGLSFSSDGRLLASSSEDRSIRVLAASDLRPLATLEEHTDAVWRVAFSPDGKLLASASRDGTVRLWDVAGWRQVGVLEGHRQSVLGLAFDSKGRFLASSSRDGELRVWDLGSKQLSWRQETSDGSIASVAFDPKGELLASAHGDGSVRLWHIDAAATPRALRGHYGRVAAVAFLPDGDHLVSGSSDNTVRVWSVASGQPLRSLEMGSPIVSLAVDAAASRLAVTDVKLGLSLWDLRLLLEPERVAPSADDTLRVAFSPDGRKIVAGGAAPELMLYDVDTGAARALRTTRGADVTTSITFAADGAKVYSGHWDGSLRVWSVEAVGLERTLSGHRALVSALGCSPDGTKVVSASHDGQIRIWDARTGDELAAVAAHKGAVSAARFSPDGNWLASTGADGAVRLWRLAGVTVSRGPEWRPPEVVYDLVFLSDGARLATIAREGILRIWEPWSGQMTELVGAHVNGYRIEAAPPGDLLVTSHEDQVIRVWNLAARDSRSLSTGALQINDIALSPGGALIAASCENTVCVWEASNLRPYWRTVGVVVGAAGAPEVLTHQGWLPEHPHPPERWRTAAQASVRTAMDARGEHACVETAVGGLEQWDTKRDEVIWRREAPGAVAVGELDASCFWLQGSDLRREHADGEEVTLASSVTAASTSGEIVWATDDSSLQGFDSHAEAPLWHVELPEMGGRVTATVGAPPWFAVGDASGEIAVLDEQGALALRLRGTVASAVTQLSFDDERTLLAAGHRNGRVVLWSVRDGLAVEERRLRGQVTTLLFAEGKLLAATAQGDTLAWSMAPFRDDPCVLLGRVWRSVPVAWRTGRAERTEPADHRCANAAPSPEERP